MKKSLLLIAVLFAGFVLHGQSPVTRGALDGDKVGLFTPSATADCSGADECFENVSFINAPGFTLPVPDYDHHQSITLVSGCVPASKFQLTFTVTNPSRKDMVEVIVTTCSKNGTWGKPKRRFYSVPPEIWGR